MSNICRRYDAAGGTVSLNELKSMMMNTEANETEAKARCTETTMALNAAVENSEPKREENKYKKFVIDVANLII